MNEMTAGGASPAPTREIERLTPEQLGGEIRLLTSQARRMALSYAIQIGYRLKVAHDKVGPHGWAEWLKRETEFSAAAASRFESLYAGYGEDQGSFFGVGNKFPTLENISISNALRLLAVSEEEREQVAAEVDAEHLSARELEKALAERDAALRAAAEAREERGFWEDEATKKAIELDKANAAAESKDQEILRLAALAQDDKKRIQELESRPVEVAVERDEEAIQEAADAAKKAAEEKAAAELNKLRKKLEKAEAAQKKAEEEAKVAAEQAAKKDDGILRSAQDDKKKAEEKAAKAQEEAEGLRKKLISAESGANVAAALFSQAQQSFNAALEKVAAMKSTHPEIAAKLLSGMEQALSRMVESVREAGA